MESDPYKDADNNVYFDTDTIMENRMIAKNVDQNENKKLLNRAKVKSYVIRTKSHEPILKKKSGLKLDETPKMIDKKKKRVVIY